MSNSFIYGIRFTYDLTHEFRYVGKTNRGTKRFEEHLKDYRILQRPIYDWMRKHFGCVTFEILEEGTTATLNDTERKWIHLLKARGHRLLNGTLGGDGGNTFAGKKHRPETIEKMSKAQIGKKHSIESIEKMRQSSKGQIVSQETREKMSKAALGRCHSDITRKRLSESHKALNRSFDNKGEKNPAGKLSNADVLDIREMAAQGVSIEDIMSKYAMSKRWLLGIIRRKTWTHI